MWPIHCQHLPKYSVILYFEAYEYTSSNQIRTHSSSSLLWVGYLVERLTRRIEPVVDAEAELAPDPRGLRGPGIRRRRT